MHSRCSKRVLNVELNFIVMPEINRLEPVFVVVFADFANLFRKNFGKKFALF